MRVNLRRNVCGLAASRSGLAATEFALLLPVIVVLFFGLVEVSDAMTVNRKVAIAANTLADLAAQSETIKISEMDDLFEGVLTIVEPNDPTGMNLKLISVVRNPDGDPVVHWSRDYLGNTPYAPGSAYTTLKDPDILSTNGSLIVVEMTYVYTPTMTSHVLELPIVFSRETIRWPRLVAKVQLCDAGGNNCTT